MQEERNEYFPTLNMRETMDLLQIQFTTNKR